MSIPVTGALYMFDKGFKVFPLRPNGKEPINNQSWKEWASSGTRIKIQDYGDIYPDANWGVDCGASGLYVIDIDNKNGIKGGKTLKELEAANSKIPETFTVKTPTGGYHLYFYGKGRNTAGSIGKGIDTRGEGGYVVCPGSKLKDEKGSLVFYDIISKNEIANLPLWILNSTKKNIVEKEVIEQDVPEGERNHTLASFLGSLRSRGAGIETLKAAGLAFNEEQFALPLPEYEVLRTAESISRYKPKIAQAAIDFTSTANIETMQKDKDWPLDYDDFKKGQAPERIWIIKDWLPAYEISSLYGSGSAGKSLLTLQLGLAVAAGTEFLGIPIDRKMFFLGIYCEDSKDELHRRLDAIRSAPEYEFTDPNGNFKLWPRTGKENALVEAKNNDVVAGPFMPKLRAYLKTLPKKQEKLIVLDTLSDIYMGDENTREKVNKCIKVHIGSLALEFNCTMLLLAHPSRTGQTTGDMLSGSTAWENAVRNRLGMETKDGITKIMRLKSNYALNGEELNLIWEEGRFIKTTTKAEEADKAEEEDLSKYLYENVQNEKNLMEIISDISTNEKYVHLFKRVNSISKRRDRIITLIRRNLSYEDCFFSYEYREGKYKHWVVKEPILT